MFIEKRGAKAQPARTIDAAQKATCDMPEHLEVRRGTVDDVEAVCRSVVLVLLVVLHTLDVTREGCIEGGPSCQIHTLESPKS